MFFNASRDTRACIPTFCYDDRSNWVCWAYGANKPNSSSFIDVPLCHSSYKQRLKDLLQHDKMNGQADRSPHA